MNVYYSNGHPLETLRNPIDILKGYPFQKAINSFIILRDSLRTCEEPHWNPMGLLAAYKGDYCNPVRHPLEVATNLIENWGGTPF